MLLQNLTSEVKTAVLTAPPASDYCGYKAPYKLEGTFIPRASFLLNTYESQ